MSRQVFAVRFLDATDRDADSPSRPSMPTAGDVTTEARTWTPTLTGTSWPIAKRCGAIDWPSPRRASSR